MRETICNHGNSFHEVGVPVGITISRPEKLPLNVSLSDRSAASLSKVEEAAPDAVEDTELELENKFLIEYNVIPYYTIGVKGKPWMLS